MSQPRQQGLGNIYAFLYCGVKVYIRSDVTSWNFLRTRGFEIFDTLKLREESFASLTRFDEHLARRNQIAAAELLDDRNIVKLWGEIFAGGAPVVACDVTPAELTRWRRRITSQPSA